MIREIKGTARKAFCSVANFLTALGRAATEIAAEDNDNLTFVIDNTGRPNKTPPPDEVPQAH